MHRQIGHRHVARDRAQQLPRLQGRADADGVAERDFVAAEIPQHFCDVDHRLRLDLALIGAAEHGGDIAAHPDAIGFGARQHRLEPLDRFRNRAIDIGARKAFRRGGEHRDQFGAGGLRGLVSLLVRHQHREFAIRVMADAAQHLGRSHHLRDRLGRDERADLDRLSPAPISASMKAIRSATLIGVFSFCSPSRGPTSTMWTRSLMTPPVRLRQVRRLRRRYRRPCT